MCVSDVRVYYFVSVYIYIYEQYRIVCTNRDQWTRRFLLSAGPPCFSYTTCIVASRPIRTFFSVAGYHTHQRGGWGGGRGRWGRYILRVSYNLTNIQTFRGVCNSEECISEVVALNSIRRCLMIFWFFFFVFFFLTIARMMTRAERLIDLMEYRRIEGEGGRTFIYILETNWQIKGRRD